jgi:hypothetical protein
MGGSMKDLDLANAENTKEVTLELNNVTGVNKGNVDAVAAKLEEMYAAEIKATIGADLGGAFASIWPPDQSLEDQKKGLEEKDEIRLWFFKLRTE